MCECMKGEYVRVSVGTHTGRYVHGLSGDEPHCPPVVGRTPRHWRLRVGWL